jgi:GNAT superfamily N-acetyltransferase
MHDHQATQATAIRALTQQELPLLREHLLRLDPSSRRDRFNGTIDDGFIERYAAKCRTDGTIILAYLADGLVRGAAELHQPDLSNPMPEVAFSVEAELRGQGIGSLLFTRLIEAARALGYDELRITTGSGNEAMRALARKFGADLTFRRGESTGSIDLTQGAAERKSQDKSAAASLPSATKPLTAARAMMNFNNAYWKLLMRMTGFGRTA